MAKKSDIFKWIAFGSLILCIIGAFIVDVGKIWFVVSGIALLISFLSVAWILNYMETMIEGFDMIIEKLDSMQGKMSKSAFELDLGGTKMDDIQAIKEALAGCEIEDNE